MIKPKTEAKPKEGWEFIGRFFYVNGKALSHEEIKEIYDDMVDDLMQLYKYALENQPNYLLTQKYIQISKIKQTLIKAGVKTEDECKE